MAAPYIFLVAIVVYIISWFGADSLEKDRKKISPNSNPYAWGYFTGLVSCIGGSLWTVSLVIYIFTVKDTSEQMYAAGFSVYFITRFIAGWHIIERKRWAWLVTIPLLLNPIYMLANSIYLSNRWAEMKTEEKARHQANQASPITNEELFFLNVNGEEIGPYTKGQIKSMWNNGSLTADSYYRLTHNQEWLRTIDLVS